ncbi:MAG: bis(5'-nucleosyl)-tetraphosphatase (symmetrical) YqeK [Peptostreptococcaceae bacterium]|nr:bis(5'-nucleosyl)-tetraphosphatase (symmetrical) YqeK [Peptostreptococcaceae bacterium]
MNEQILADISRKELLGVLLEILGEKRLQHVLGVEKMAVFLGARYGADLRECRTAALFHDLAKYFSVDRCRKILTESGYIPDRLETDSVNLMHSKVSAIIAEKEYGVGNRSVLSAIRKHTTASANMSLLDKIIFVSDAIEETRSYDKVELFREIAPKDLDEALKMILDEQIIYLVRNDKSIHPNSIEARNFLLNHRGNL